MIFLHIDPTSSKKEIDLFNKYVKDGKHIFVLFYLEGCGPCNATRPEWGKIKNVLSHKDNNNTIVVADVDQSVMNKLQNLDVQPKGFPSMYHISNKGKESHDYEDADISKKDRTIDSFVEWIEKHINENTRNRENNMRGGKWSLKYKRSINCKHPKGFSQRQHCKYGRKNLRSSKNKTKSKTKSNTKKRRK